MKKFKLNKKGFTLVELLAVIVILALLIVITANTILPMMNKSKQNAMLVYANRVLSNASSMYQSDSISDGSSESQYYSIAKLMNQDDYYGCVMVSVDEATSNYIYNILIYDMNNKLYIEGQVDTNNIEGDVDDIVQKDTVGNKIVEGDEDAVAEHADCDPDAGVEYETDVLG